MAESKRAMVFRMHKEYTLKHDKAAPEQKVWICRQAFAAFFEIGSSLLGNKGGQAKVTRGIALSYADHWVLKIHAPQYMKG